MEKEKIVILLHGFKKKDFDDFNHFVNYAKGKTKYKIVPNQYWYDNHDKSSLNWQKMSSSLDKIVDGYKDKEIILIGYSMGGVASFREAAKNDNVISFMALYPAFYINFKGWVKVLLNNIKKWKEMRKRLGKERYKRMKQLKSKGVSEKYPITLAWNINLFRKKQIKYISRLKNKKIFLVWSKNDEVTQDDRVFKMLDKKLNKKLNNFTKLEATESHFNALDENQTKMFDRIIDFINSN